MNRYRMTPGELIVYNAVFHEDDIVCNILLDEKEKRLHILDKGFEHFTSLEHAASSAFINRVYETLTEYGKSMQELKECDIYLYSSSGIIQKFIKEVDPSDPELSFRCLQIQDKILKKAKEGL